MGADTSTTHMVFFITSVIIALAVTGALFLNIQSISSAVNIGSKTLSEQLKTDVTVINDPDQIPNASSVYTFYVKNTGDQYLDTNYINVIIDGTLIPDGNVAKAIIGSNTVWDSGDVLEVNVTTSLLAGNHKLRVITDNGIEDEFLFKT